MISAVDRQGEKTGTGTHQAPGPRIACEWQLRGFRLDLTTPAVMGILNLTPDSFSDGGELGSLERALQRARILMEEGARVLDVGGESTRPGALAVPAEEEMERILPFIRAAEEAGLGPISVDTRNAEVAREALRSGARIVNDVSGLKHDPDMARVVAEEGAGVVLSHMRGTPSTMKGLTDYGDVVAEVMDELGASLTLALGAGVPRERIVVGPAGSALTTHLGLGAVGLCALCQAGQD